VDVPKWDIWGHQADVFDNNAEAFSFLFFWRISAHLSKCRWRLGCGGRLSDCERTAEDVRIQEDAKLLGSGLTIKVQARRKDPGAKVLTK
jgi:hypothetical protein